MALKKTINTIFGIDVVDAYHRVEALTLNNKTSMTFLVRAYKGADQNAAIESKHHTCEYSIEGSNPIAQAYAYLKTLEEFAKAVDC